LKKLFFIIIIFCIPLTSSQAAFFIDGQGNYMSTGDFNPVTGFGLGIGLSIADDINFIVRGFMTQNTDNPSDPLIKKTYEYNAVTGGIEYIPPIVILEQYRIYWKNSINIGASMFSIDDKSGNIGKKTENGLITSFTTGLQYNFTQVISPYFDLGYHKTFYQSNSKLSISGWQIDLGVRFYVFGNRDYNAGY